MSKHDIVEPTVDQYGSDTHPAFGQISASRGSYSGQGAILFDSDVRHQHTVTITVTEATRQRSNGHDYIHGGTKRLIEVEMSEAQWASFVSSMNTSGVPCTLKATETQWNIPGLPYAPRLAQSMAEVKEAADRLMVEIKAARDAYEKALADKAPAAVRNEALRKLHFTIENAEANANLAAKKLAEHAENVVQKARADIEAMVGAEATRLGLTSGQAEGLLALPAMPGEGVEVLDEND